MLVSLSVSETKDFNLQSKMEISDDSEAITDSEEEYSRSIGKIVTVNKMKGEKKNGTFYSTGHYLFHLAKRWYVGFCVCYFCIRHSVN